MQASIIPPSPRNSIPSRKSFIWPQPSNFDVSSDRKRIPCKYVLSQKCLGNGSFSKVYECKHIETHAHFAVKVIGKKNNRNKIKLIQNEFRILSKISHSISAITGVSASSSVSAEETTNKYLLKLHDYFETDEHFYLITDLAIGGDLFDKILNDGCYRVESDGIKIINSILAGLLFLKKHNIIHRDLKAENIFFKYGSSRFDVLIGDFGLSTYVSNNDAAAAGAAGNNDDDDLSNILCGTLSYMAPEILKRQPYSFPVDVWSLGVLIYFMFCGYMPFDCETDDETKEAILTADYMFDPPEYWDHVSVNMRNVISDCFVIDQVKRSTLEDIQNNIYLRRLGNKTETPARRSINNSHTDLARYLMPIIEDPESTAEEEDIHSGLHSRDSNSSGFTSIDEGLVDDPKDAEEREKALKTLRESLYGSLKTGTESPDTDDASNLLKKKERQRNGSKKATFSLADAVSSATVGSGANGGTHSAGRAGNANEFITASQNSFSYTSLRDLANKRSSSSTSLKDLINLNFSNHGQNQAQFLRTGNHSLSNTNIAGLSVFSKATSTSSSNLAGLAKHSHDSHHTSGFPKMNGALSTEPEVSAHFRAASVRSNASSRLNSTFNSINPSRINSRNQSRAQSRIPSRIPSRNHSRVHSTVASKPHSRTSSIS